MGARQRDWARKARAALVASLGGRCVECGARHDLEFDHIFRRDWHPRTVESSARISRYRREAAEGLITLRCAPCNGRRGQPDNYAPGALSMEGPF